MGPSLLLTKLPIELRTSIWELALRVPSTNADDNHELVWLTPDQRPRPSVLSLLLTCRQINHEAADIFYRVNRLAIHVAVPNGAGPGPTRDPHNVEASVARFLKSLSPPRLSSLHSLCIWLGEVYRHKNGGWGFDCQELHTTCKRLRRVPNLKTLHLMWDHPTEIPDDEPVCRCNRKSRCFPPAFRPSTDTEQASLERVFIPDYEPTISALQLLRHVEELTVWGRDASQEDDPLLAKALQTSLPKYRVRHGLEWLYSQTIKKCRYMCTHGCESLDCEHLCS